MKTSMNILDDLGTIEKIDRRNMREVLRSTPDMYIDFLKKLKEEDMTSVINKLPSKKPTKTIILGMGGSALGGEILKDWLADASEIPIELCRDYHLANYADKDTLVIALSYSGNTEETINGFVEALDRKCMTIAVSSGGVLEEFCNLSGTPLIKVPKGLPPRCATPYLLLSLAKILNKFEFMPFDEAEINEATETLRKLWKKIRPECPVNDNSAKKMALDIFGSIPVIYGFRHYKSIALAIKIAFNENSKIPSKCEFFPELIHNEIVGFEKYKRSIGNITVVLIRDSDEPPEIKVAIEVVKELISLNNTVKILEVYGEGTSRLAKMLSVKYVADMASLYLAILNNTDPMRTQSIDVIKSETKAKLNLIENLRKRIKNFDNFQTTM